MRLRAWLLALLIAAGGAAAQPYPDRPVRFVVPFAAGGGTDIVGRLVAQSLGDALGQTFVVDNRPGAGSLLGSEIVATSAPNGYTLLLGNISLAFNVGLFRKMPFDPARDLLAVTLVADQPNLLVIHPSLPAKSFKELVAFVRAHPGKVSFASAGTGSGTHLAAELLRTDLKLDMVHIPYKGTGPALTDLIGGQVQMMLSTFASALPYVQSGRLRGIAVTSAKRSAAAPDVPTVAESGLPGYQYSTWYGLFAPAGTPRLIVDRLYGATVQALKGAEIAQKFAAQGVEPASSESPQAFEKFVRAEIAKWPKLMRDAGIPQQ
jgi:tripartite-type tricarboxylate transporter receptor subunit TctC